MLDLQGTGTFEYVEITTEVKNLEDLGISPVGTQKQQREILLDLGVTY